MDTNIVQFPFIVSRRAHARRPRTKNSPPQNSNPLRAKSAAVSRAATIAGLVNYKTRDLSGIGPIGKRHLQEFRSVAEEARYLASEFKRAMELVTARS
jgi:hypothetical protein